MNLKPHLTYKSYLKIGHEFEKKHRRKSYTKQGKEFLVSYQEQIAEETDNLDFIQIKNFWSVKNPVKIIKCKLQSEGIYLQTTFITKKTHYF